VGLAVTHHFETRMIAALWSVALASLAAASLSAQTVSIGPAVFKGTGLNDATSGGRYSAGLADAQYTVTISAIGRPDRFRWSKNGGALSPDVAITGRAQPVTDGVTIAFAAITGHRLNDSWTIVTRNAQDKLRDIISVRDFGAKGDGLTDDTAAVRAAAAYACGLSGPGRSFSLPEHILYLPIR